MALCPLRAHEDRRLLPWSLGALNCLGRRVTTRLERLFGGPLPPWEREWAPLCSARQLPLSSHCVRERSHWDRPVQTQHS